MKKYNIDFKDSSTLNFEELYTAVMKKTKHIKFKHNLTKTMKENVFKELNHQKKLLMKNDTIIMHVNNTFSFCQQSEFMKKSKLKIVLNTVIQNQLDNLSLKTEIF